jgi:hypothetical protein
MDTAFAGIRQYYAVTAALDLGLFEALCTRRTAGDCARILGCKENLITLLCESLVRAGLLVKDGDLFFNAPAAETFLARDSPFCQQHAIAFQRRLAGLWADLPRILREGPVTYDREEMFSRLIIPSMAENCRCGLLQQVTGLVGAQPEFTSSSRLLDLGGGHGLYAIALCQKNPHLAATVFDLPAVTQATLASIERYRATRVSILAGDFFADPIGSGYDIIFSSSNPGGKVPSLIPKIANALNPGGLFINKQAVDEERPDPYLSLEWNLWTFTGAAKQAQRYVFEDSVPFDDYNKRLEEHGLTVREVIPVDAQSAMTIATKTRAR